MTYSIGDRVRIIESGIHYDEADKVGTILEVIDFEFSDGEPAVAVVVRPDGEDYTINCYDDEVEAV